VVNVSSAMLPLPMPESRNNERGTRWFQAR
jgi:hypothetical protein